MKLTSSKIKGGNPYVVPFNNHLNDPLSPNVLISTRQVVGGKSKKQRKRGKSIKKKKTIKKRSKKTKSKKTKQKKLKGGSLLINAHNANPVLTFNTFNGASISSNLVNGVNNPMINSRDMNYVTNQSPFV
jgi:hypothetical protein